MRVKLFMDGADINDMVAWSKNPRISGFTTNPTLMRKAGINDYEAFAKEAIRAIPNRPISFEVFSDDFSEMEEEAHIIHGWGGDTYIKIPITNTKGESAIPLIQTLSAAGYSLNVTAIMTLAQVQAVADAINPKARTIISVFAGRIADTGIDPIPVMQKSLRMLKDNKKAELLWASPRELLNIVQADECGCHIITATPDILKKLELIGKNLEAYSLETVKMFYNDAKAAGFDIRSKHSSAKKHAHS